MEQPQDTPEIDHIAGQLAAMQMAIDTLILAHPKRREVERALSERFANWATAGIYSAQSEKFLDGFAFAQKHILPPPR